MKQKDLIKLLRSVSEPFRITCGEEFRLKDVDPGDTLDFTDKRKKDVKELLRASIEMLTELQQRLYADDRWAVLLVFQAMDAAGKDSAIKHVMSGVNPQGCQVFSFKAPSAEELDHDFMWRCIKRLPERGCIGIFNRSYYEETLIVRVHPELLRSEKLPTPCISKNIWQERFEDIRNIERYLTRNGMVIRKFFLHVSKEEQRKRFLARLDKPEKNWKFSLNDVSERRYWNRYMRAYEDMIRNTATEWAPWFVVPADHKWFTHLVVAAGVIDVLMSLHLEYPRLDRKQKDALRTAREWLEKE